MGEPQSEEINADFARQWWKSLMSNAVALVEDAAALADRGSAGRAQALLVLAMEEVAKARWLYKSAEWEWSASLGLYGSEPHVPGSVQVPDGLRAIHAPHAKKLQVAEQFASGLGGFWDPERRIEYYQLPDLETFRESARQRDLDKQAGFYVDRAGDRITSPLDIPARGIAEQIRQAAKVIQMHLIEDHTRQQDASVTGRIDSAEALHWAILPYSDPELFVEEQHDTNVETGDQ